MKKVILSLCVVFALLACEGPQGPPGEPGVNILGQTFEFENIDFKYEPANNLYSALVTIPNDIEVFDSDAILVYILQTVPGTNGPVDTYSLIPQEFYLPQGTIEYVYNHTANDVELLIDGNFDLSTLDPSFTKDQVFRFVVIPSEFATNPNVNMQTYADLLNSGVEMKVLDVK